MAQEALDRRGPTVVVVANTKGGVGKTVTAVTLALGATDRLGAAGRVLLIDTDPGRSALVWAIDAGGRWPERCAYVGHTLANLTDVLGEVTEGYDLVIIDTPPEQGHGVEVGPVLADALGVADVVIVPTPPSAFDVSRVGDLARLLDRHGIEWHLLLTRTKFTRRALLAQARDHIGRRGYPLLADVIPDRAAIADAADTSSTAPLGWYGPVLDVVMERVA